MRQAGNHGYHQQHHDYHEPKFGSFVHGGPGDAFDRFFDYHYDHGSGFYGDRFRRLCDSARAE